MYKSQANSRERSRTFTKPNAPNANQANSTTVAEIVSSVERCMILSGQRLSKGRQG
ncbi:hypothetical protein RBWH47_03358 [Rhodopirellula baltica WH47]|uniref:Uncharacterized protein n=1 Tax=Rhodopirellula baltica WH47 TaxID=991778 RepID=F2APZ0_RHOBT|nr:hypothetical protein RBWH47_03358 [Rhodopirellula baltica WH47]